MPKKILNTVNSKTKDIQAELNFCYDILPAVSRTFAISINHLKGNLHFGVLTGYLLCRIADTIEDAPKISKKQKRIMFDTLSKSLATLDANEITKFEKMCVKLTGNPEHIRLCTNSHKVLAIFSLLPKPSQKVIRKWVETMIKGMRDFVSLYPSGIRIKSVKEYKLYCFYVAGTVGHLLTGLWTLHGPEISDQAKKTLEKHCAAFGEGLQTVNILKDVAEDAVIENNIYIPEDLLKKGGSSHRLITQPKYLDKSYESIKVMLDLAQKNLNNAFIYYQSIPKLAIKIRLFCLVPLLFAFATLKELSNTKNMLIPGKKVKISRRKMKLILFMSHFAIFSNTISNALVNFLKVNHTR